MRTRIAGAVLHGLANGTRFNGGYDMECPNCKKEMTTMTLAARLAGDVTIDLCNACQAFWFDAYESLHLSPAATLQLMQLIGKQSSAPKATFRDELNCPRCSAPLSFTHDMQRTTRFQYWRCETHGRFIMFFDFLKEKNFIRVLSGPEIERLRQNIQTVNCSNCGAAIDLVANSFCSHCGSPISILDMKQPQELMAQLQNASRIRPVDPDLPAKLAQAKHEVESELGFDHQDTEFWHDASSSGLVQAGLSAVARWLSKSGI